MKKSAAEFKLLLMLATGDRYTDKLLDQIKEIARELSRDEPWYANRYTFDVFKAAIDALLLSHLPSGEAKQETRPTFKPFMEMRSPRTSVE